MLAHVRQQGVAAGGDQAHEGRFERAIDEVRGDMALDVVDGGERQLARGGERLGGGEPHEQRPHEARTAGRGDEPDVVERAAGIAQRLLDHEVHELQVVAGGDLGDHAAEAVVDSLRGDRVRAHRAAGRVEHRGAGVVAAALQRENRACCRRTAHTNPGLGTSSSEPVNVAGVRHMTSASSPLSW